MSNATMRALPANRRLGGLALTIIEADFDSPARQVGRSSRLRAVSKSSSSTITRTGISK